ncbi:MAG: hypothetical protein JWO02_238, partial [Solirubrobacterales bacterium]|nr:hypothetical protein [Solirubrobacterales bacterium]
MNRRELLLRGAAAAPLLLDPVRVLAAAPRPIALVTADEEAHVAVVDLAAGRVRRRVRTVQGPRSIEAAPGGGAVVAHTTSGVVTLLDGPTTHVRRVLRGFAEPRYTVVDR